MADGFSDEERGLPRLLVDGVAVVGGVVGVVAATGMAGVTAGVVTGATLAALGFTVWRRRDLVTNGSLRDKKDAFARALVETRTYATLIDSLTLAADDSADVKKIEGRLIEWQNMVERIVDEAIGPIAAEQFRRSAKEREVISNQREVKPKSRSLTNLSEYESNCLHQVRIRVEAYTREIDQALDSIPALSEADFR